MFIDTRDFDFIEGLEASAAAIREEFKNVSPARLLPWPESWLYKAGWNVFGLWALGNRLHRNCDVCPTAAAAVEAIPGMMTAGFSCLAPGTRISPHIGYTNSVLRLHLGLVVPDNCGICVGGDTRSWHEGKCLVFDDTTEHSAWNDSGTVRVVLLVDFLRPGAEFDPSVSNEAAAALIKVLDTNAALADSI